MTLSRMSVHRTLLAISVTATLFAFGWCIVGLAPSALQAATTYDSNPHAGEDVDSGVCDAVTSVPPEECVALVVLYNQTNGANWTNNDNWLVFDSGVTPCDWYGVSCAQSRFPSEEANASGGRIAGLELGQNALEGPLPRSLGQLTGLERLDLGGNQLSGYIPRTLCTLPESLELDLGYNALESPHRAVRECIERLDPDWASTQTVAPRNLQITDIQTNAIEVTWTPLLYKAGGGYYEIGVSTGLTGPVAFHGRTADRSAASYLVDGLQPGTTYFVHVRSYTPAHEENPGEIWSERRRTVAVTQGMERMLLLVYFSADNDLSPHVQEIAARLRRGSQRNPNVTVVMLADRRGPDNTEIIHIVDGQLTRTNMVADHWGRLELDTGDPAVLSWFLSTTRETFAADRTFVSLIGHGTGPAPELAPSPEPVLSSSEQRTKVPPLPQEQDITPGDVTDQSYMSTVELGKALATATQNGSEPFDLLFFDQCFQGNLDVLYEVHTSAEIFIASPNYAWLSAPYDRYLSQLEPRAGAETIADTFIRVYEASLDPGHPNVIFHVHGSDIPGIAGAVSGLADALGSALDSGDAAKILSASLSSRYADTTRCGANVFSLEPPDELIGAGRFAHSLMAQFPEGDPAGVHQAAGDLVQAIAGIERVYQVGRPYLAPDQIWDYDDAITILAPLRRNTPASVAWRASIYTETAPLTARWSSSPTGTVTISSALAFAREGRWDNFLGQWYTNFKMPTVGQWCRYIPPARRIDEDAEPLTLALHAEPQGIASLSWTPTSSDEAEAYWLFARSQATRNWTVEATLPLTTTTYVLEPSIAQGRVHQVFAQRADGLFVAESNEIVWQEGGAYQLYLPVLAGN